MMELSNPETLYVAYEGEKPFIQATVTDGSGIVRYKFVDTSITNLIREVKASFRGYRLEVQVPGRQSVSIYCSACY